ncbi:MAG: DNA repair protein RecN [Actinobacteria bacterium]|uniref:DNA repair protein RecN n=1 Tax=freshwater metagenome TaxID=449393 RepID=A0A6J6RWP3_9ZZZZ|nr:DNA repair protein RecN [Actinomycetota bacterium]MSZ01870.1 DNA repair protein RecN [Actinomycetota bacterium]
MSKKSIAKSSLRELTIRNLGVIDTAEIEFKSGLTVITGETGAGKTMVLTALNLILGGKSDSDFVRSGQERLVVSGKFEIGEAIASIVDDAGGFVEEHEVIINRSITNQGKSKISLGGAVSSAGQVSELAENLIEIHAQASSARLSKSTVQLELLDAFGNHEKLLSEYSQKYEDYLQLRKRINELEKQLSIREVEIAKLEGIVKDFERIKPRPGEISELDNEITKLGAVEELNAGIIEGLGILNSEENSAVSALGISKKIFENLKGKDSALDALIDEQSDSIYELLEVTSKLERYLSQLEADPSRFDFLQTRKSELLGLIKKYGKGTDREVAYENLLAEASDASSRLLDLQGGDLRLEELNGESIKLFGELRGAAKALSKSRLDWSNKLSEAITNELSLLAMPNARLVVDVIENDSESAKSYSPTGINEVSFLFTSHTDGKLLPLSKGASGGELSRVMLAVEVVLAKNSTVGTYIFDEVDAGVGGKAAVEVGKRLALLARNSQVIVVTHLAQVASWADNHLVVSKSETGSVTQSNIIEVTGGERRKEIARLLSGQDESISAQEHAGELLDMVAKAMAEMIG